MTTEIEKLRAELRADLRALLAAPVVDLPDYQADPSIRGRLGQMLVAATKKKRHLH